MRRIRIHHYRFASVLAAIALLCATALFVLPQPAQAAVIPNAITSVTITHGNGVSTGDFSPDESVLVNAVWAVPAGITAASGDTFSMTLPQELAGLGKTFPLFVPNSTTVVGNCTAQATRVDCTLNDYVTGKTDIHGTLYFSGQLQKNQLTTNSDNKLNFVVNSVTIPVTIHVADVGTAGTGAHTMNKSCYIPTGTTSLTCAIYLPDGADLTNVVVTDTVTTGNAGLTPGTKPVLKEAPVGNGTFTDSNVPYTITNAANGFTFKADSLPATSTKFVINYTMDVTDGGAGPYKNTANITATEAITAPTSVESVVYAAGGTGIGTNQPVTPVVSTQASAQTAVVGDTVHDTVVVTGTGGATVTVNWSLLGPVPPVNGKCDLTPAAWQGAVTADSGSFQQIGDTPTAGVVIRDTTVKVAGCYTYVETLPATPATPTTPATDLVSPKPGVPAETVLVTPKPLAPVKPVPTTTTPTTPTPATTVPTKPAAATPAPTTSAAAKPATTGYGVEDQGGGWLASTGAGNIALLSVATALLGVVGLLILAAIRPRRSRR